MTDLAGAQAGPSTPTVWVLTDGKIGDDVQCIAVASALSLTYEKRVVAPRAPWAWFAPWGPISPHDRPEKPESPINGAPPDIIIASGRRAIAYARVIKRTKAGRTRVVILKDPRIGRTMADVIWAPAHDRLEGANVFSTLTSPHQASAKITQARANPTGVIADLPRPLLGVILGGPSGGARYGPEQAEAFVSYLQSAADSFKALAITPSRRTPGAFIKVLRDRLFHDNLFIWDGKDPNPYHDILASAAALIVAADSHNMMSEALASSAGVYAWRPPGLAKKMAWFVDQLEAAGAVRPLSGAIEAFERPPIDATPEIVAEIKKSLGLLPA